ncbi:hypothetical protein BJF84_21730 [Rhodococcus sp. CUA-806]|nr:hypothetical protein BJF84_21730 [Rhodococcus sp. CUA-806]
MRISNRGRNGVTDSESQQSGHEQGSGCDAHQQSRQERCQQEGDGLDQRERQGSLQRPDVQYRLELHAERVCGSDEAEHSEKADCRRCGERWCAKQVQVEHRRSRTAFADHEEDSSCDGNDECSDDDRGAESFYRS